MIEYNSYLRDVKGDLELYLYGFMQELTLNLIKWIEKCRDVGGANSSSL